MNSEKPTTDDILGRLCEIPDPELGVNIVDLGLIYEVDCGEDEVKVTMTLTTPNCPMSTYMPAAVEQKVLEYYPDYSVTVNLVYVPLWNPEMISDKGKMELGIS